MPSGTPPGDLEQSYTPNLASEVVNGGPPVTYRCDADGLLTVAGALQIQRDPATGFQTGVTLGGITESRTYSAYGEEASYTSSFAGSNLYSVTYARDALGRISSKTERVGAERFPTADHEEQHTYQSEVLGPFYLPVAGISPQSRPPRPW